MENVDVLERPASKRRTTAKAGSGIARGKPPSARERDPQVPAVPLQEEREESRPDAAFRAFDRGFDAAAAPFTFGLSPAALSLAYLDWALHLAQAPGKRLELAFKAWSKINRLTAHALRCSFKGDAERCIEPLPGDRRFRADAWQKMPFALWYQAFLLSQQWWHSATRGVPGVTPHHEDVVSFAARQILDVFSPANSPFTNPEVIERAIATGGRNFLDGYMRFLDDVARQIAGQPPAGAEDYRVGHDVAVTPGKVVYRNRLMELIQYAPATGRVHAEPVLIVPAWIMKYYILDLSPQNSLIRYLVEQGHTVLCISWRNVDGTDRDRGLDDYRRLGIMEALDAVGKIAPDAKIHTVGYCLGGTLLAIAAAAMANAHDERLASITLLAAQTDFSEPGELELFVDHSQVEYLEGPMWQRGYFAAEQMAGAFQLLRSNDLIWSRLLRHYLMGERPFMNDLMAWNADGTRLPSRMHSEYLRSLFLNNDLAAGRYVVDEHPVAIQNIRVPVFAVGTEWDHVAPWRSVYKIHTLANTDVTFLLTSGGHNAGIVSPPARTDRRYRIKYKGAADPLLDPERWSERAAMHEGSWWPAWAEWLSGHSSRGRVSPPDFGAPDEGLAVLADAPGTYIHQR